MKKIQFVSLVVVIIVFAVGIALLRKSDKLKDGAGVSKPVSTVGGGENSGTEGPTGAGAPDGDVTATRPHETHQQVLNRKLMGLNMSPAVRSLLGLNVDKGDREARRGALEKLTRTLSADDAQAVAIFLDFRQKDHPELPAATFDALKNDALVVLLNQKQVPAGLGLQLAQMFQDKEHSARWRDYSLQYLSQYYEEASEPGGKESDAIIKAFDVALAERDQKFAGTALLAMERLSRERTEFDRGKIGDNAVEIALANEVSSDSRITALRVSAMMGRTEVLPHARILAQTGETMPLRLAAIATVGDLGDKSDLEYIESLAASDDRRLQRVSKTASSNLKQRLDKSAEPAQGG